MNPAKKLFTAFLFFLVIFTLSAAPQNMDIRTEYFPPFSCGLGSKNHPGLAIEILRKVFPENKYRLNFRNQGWQWTLRELQRNNCNAVIGVAKADYPNLVYPKTPLFRTQSAVYLRKDSKLNYESPQSLSKTKTGFVADYSHSDDFDQFLKDHASDGFAVTYNGWNATDKIVNDMAAGKIQAAVNYTAVMEWILGRMKKQAKQIVLAKKLDNAVEYYIAFAPGKRESWEFVKQFDQEFPKFKKTPEYKKLLEKYGLTPDSL